MPTLSGTFLEPGATSTRFSSAKISFLLEHFLYFSVLSELPVKCFDSAQLPLVERLQEFPRGHLESHDLLESKVI